MKVYRKLILNMATGDMVYEDSFEYDGLVANLGGSNTSGKSGPAYVLPGLLPDIESGARKSIIGPAMGEETKIPFANLGGSYTVPKSLTDINMDRAVQQIRGGYGARGLANSGISMAGEQNAIGQLALQGQQQNQQALTNLLAAGTGNQSTQKSPSGISVVCTALYEQGLLDEETYKIDCNFGRELPRQVIEGYHLFAIPLARAMMRSKLVTRLAYPIASGWAREMRYRKKGDVKPSLIGKLLLYVGVPLCFILGDWKRKRSQS